VIIEYGNFPRSVYHDSHGGSSSLTCSVILPDAERQMAARVVANPARRIMNKVLTRLRQFNTCLYICLPVQESSKEMY